MKIEIRNIEIMPEISDDSLAFTSDIYIDGKQIGMAFNEGTGCNLISIREDSYIGSPIEAYLNDMVNANRGERFDQLNPRYGERWDK